MTERHTVDSINSDQLDQLHDNLDRAETENAELRDTLAHCHEREPRLRAEATEPHIYLSTGCYHNDHAYCQAMTGLNGAKRPASCKFCHASCQCPCHQQTEPADDNPDDLTGYLAPDPPIGCLTLAAERTPSQRPGLHAQLADAIRTAACDGDCGKTEEECAREHIQPIVLHHDRIAEVSGSPEMFAGAVLTLLYREWPWLRAGAEDAVPPPGS